MRVAIIGSSGSGKTTRARRLGARIGAPVVELDAINWQAGWRSLSGEAPGEFVWRVEGAIAGEAWVCDGNYRVVLDLILARATDVVWLDYPRGTVMRRVIGRSFARAIEKRELWPGTGNVETFARWLDKEHPIRWAWDTYARRRGDYAALFELLSAGGARLHHVRRPREADALVESLARRAQAPRLGTA